MRRTWTTLAVVGALTPAGCGGGDDDGGAAGSGGGTPAGRSVEVTTVRVRAIPEGLSLDEVLVTRSSSSSDRSCAGVPGLSPAA